MRTTDERPDHSGADFLRLHAQGARHCGIAYYEAGAMVIGPLIKSLILLHSVLTPEEMESRVEYL